MKKIVYNALYCDDMDVKTPNTNIRGGAENYIKQSFVSLKSALINNSDIEAVLVSNQPLPKPYNELFEMNGIKVEIVLFDDFCVPTDWRWEYAFYKLKVLDYMSHNAEADYLLGLDTDTYVALNLEGFWDECGSDNPILSPLPFDSTEGGRRQISDDYERIFKLNKREYIVQYGGEFLGGSSVALQKLAEEVKFIYRSIREMNFEVDKNSGDEAFLSMAAHKLACNPAVPYVRRYWSRRKWYEVDSAWFFVSVWHLPSEKNYGLNIMYEWLKEDKKFTIEQAAKLFNLPVQKKYNFSMIRYYLYNLMLRRG